MMKNMSPIILFAALLNLPHASDSMLTKTKIHYFRGAGMLPNSYEILLSGDSGKIISIGFSKEHKIEKKCVETVLTSENVHRIRELAIKIKDPRKKDPDPNREPVCEGSEWLEIEINNVSNRHYKPCKHNWDKSDSLYSNQIDQVCNLLGGTIRSTGKTCEPTN